MSHIVGFFTSLPFILGIILFLIFYVIQTPVLTFPIYFLMFYAGVVYGIFIGSIINVLGMFLTTTLGFYAGKLGKMDKILQSKSIIKFQNWISRNGIKAIIWLRIAPVIPYNVVSIGSGLFDLDSKKYLLYNTIAIIPYPIMWAIIGHLFGSALIERLHFEIDYRLLVPTIVIVFLIAILYFVLKTKFINHRDITDELVI